VARKRARGWRHLSPPERERVVELLGGGMRQVEVAAAMRCSSITVYRVQRDWQLRRRRVGHSTLRLRFEEREQISRGLAAGESFRSIGRGLGRAPSTISREVGGKAGRAGYRALAAHRRAVRCLARPKPGKLASWQAAPSFGTRSRPGS
jgi:IS30 family transposase